MAKFFVVGILCFSTFFLNGQTPTFNLKTGNKFELPRYAENLAFIGTEEAGLINLSHKQDKLFITHFDSSELTTTGQEEIEIPEAYRYFQSQVIIKQKKYSYWLHNDWQRSTKSETLYFDEIDNKTGKIVRSNEKLIQSEKIAGNSFSAGINYYQTIDKYRICFSADSSKILVSYKLMPESKINWLNHEKIMLCIFDAQLSPLWKRQYTMTYTEVLADQEDMMVDNFGNVYLLNKIFDTEKRLRTDKKTGKTAYHYEILKFSKETESITESRITLDQHFARDARLFQKPDHDIAFFCSYFTGGYDDTLGGIFMATLHQDSKISYPANPYYEFPREERLKNTAQSAGRKTYPIGTVKESGPLIIDQVLFETDGSIFLCGERQEKFMQQRTNILDEYRFYHSIYAIKIEGNGELDWMRKISKTQGGYAGKGTMSYKFWANNGTYNFFYMDNPKNLNRPETELNAGYSNYGDGILIMSSITKDGKLTKGQAIDSKPKSLKIFPADLELINGNQFAGRGMYDRSLYTPILIYPEKN